MKARLRRSLKRDCKAVMCIKSIVSFPEFTVQDTISEIKSKKGCRKLKAETLDKIRGSVEKGESIGQKVNCGEDGSPCPFPLKW